MTQWWPAWEGAETRSPLMLATLDLARKLATVDLPGLISGETGTGKELVARAIHRASRRAGGPFVAVNCGALPPDLVVNELFGHDAGGFTGATRMGKPGQFEQASGGTLLLDEADELPPQAQVALLRVLETGEVVRVGSHRPRRVDVRVIGATNCNLQAAVREGRFREDLYFRLNAVELVVPPLRARVEDVDLLVMFFLAQDGHGRATVSPAAMAALKAYHWPGNVRELRNVIARAVLVADGGEVLPEHLALQGPAPLGPGRWRQHKRGAVREALEQTGGNIAAAARWLGVSRGTIYRYLRNGLGRNG